MTRKRTPRRGRQAFTLIELLVVIAIIAILVGLTVTGIFKLFVKGDEVKARNDIGQLYANGNAFLVDRQITDEQLHSRLLLKEDGDYVNGIAAKDAPLALDSRRFLKRLFPNCPLVNMDWNGNGVIDSGYVILDGSQCLVFYLGGINGTKGFSANPKNPTDANTERIKLMTFEPKRLTNELFPRFKDPWDTPYAFFSSYKSGYNRYGNPNAGTGVASDCAGVEPYYTAVSATGVRTYANPRSVQIISAGPDMKFGPGGLWGPGNPAPGNGKDDIANFHSGKLGNP